MDIASCADTIRSNRTPPDDMCRTLAGDVPSSNGLWHYIDIPVPTKAKALEAFCPEGNCAPAKIKSFSETLRTSKDDAQRRQALLFLVHFVGDIHQPLHAAERGCDKGGNSEHVNFSADGLKESNVALHHVWDSSELDLLMKHSNITDDRVFAGVLMAGIKPAEADKWARATPDQMAWESYKLAVAKVYRGIPFQNFCDNQKPAPIMTDLTRSIRKRRNQSSPPAAHESRSAPGGYPGIGSQPMKILALWIALVLPTCAEIKVLKNFTLIDGTGNPAIASVAMVIENGRIVRIGSAQRVTPPPGAQVIDLDGKFVMPGIINAHGHIGNTVDLTQDPKFYTRENIEKNLRTYASYGVTTVLSLGTDQDLIFKIRDEQRAGRPTYTRVFTAGRGFTLKGGVGGMPSVTYNLENADEIRRDVDALAAKKVDIVKVWVDDSLGHRPKIPFEFSKAIIDNAHRDKLRVDAHIFYLADAKQLVNAGLDALAHSVRDQPVDQELIDSMKQHGTWQSAATLTREASMFVYAKPPAFLTDPFFTRSVSPAAIATLSDPEYQKKIAADPDFPKYAAAARNGPEESEAPGRRRNPVWDGNRHRPSRPLPRFLRTLGNGADGGCRPDAFTGSHRGNKRLGRIPARERSRHAGGWQMGRPDRPNRRPARQHPQYTDNRSSLYRRQPNCYRTATVRESVLSPKLR